MKKVLIISFYFNQKEIIGSIRLRGLAKYLPRFGWKPTILTIKLDEKSDSSFRTVETEYSDIMAVWKSKIGLNPENTVKNQLRIENKKNKKGFIDYLLEMWVEVFAYPDDKKNWYKYALESGSNLLFHENFDAMISSSHPVTSHLIAYQLKKEYNLPWIADLRDLWTQNPYWDHILIRKILEKRLESKTLKEANAITTTSKNSENILRNNKDFKKVYTIMNGFDPDEKNKVVPLKNNLRILHSGYLYNGKRDPEILFKALKELDDEERINVRDFTIDFYGYDEEWLQKDIEKYNLENIVEIHGIIDRDEILRKQRESQLLLLLTWNNEKEKAVIPGKLFEYLAAKRPILSIGSSESFVKEIINSTNSGVHLSEYNDIKDRIKCIYDQFKFNGYIEYNGNEKEIDKYSQVKMAEKFAMVLNELRI